MIATASNPHKVNIAHHPRSSEHYRWMWTFVHLIRLQRDIAAKTAR